MPLCAARPALPVTPRLALLLAVLAPLAAAQDPRGLIRRAVEADHRNDDISRNYTYVQRATVRTLNGDGSVKKTEVRTHDVTLSDGMPYHRLIQIDDKPLPPKLERQEQEKLRRSIEKRQMETPQQRAKRIAEWEKKRQKERAFVDELLDAMDFRIAGEEPIGGRKTWVIEATPHPGYRAKSLEAKFLAKMRGRIWLDQAEDQAVRMEAEAIGDISIGGFLAKVHKGTRFLVEWARINDEVWLPQRAEGKVSARVLTAHSRQDFEITYRDYRKFQAESRILSTGADRK